MSAMRGWVKKTLLGMANVNRIHIVGCARSGTTMLHYAMVAFQNTLLFDSETQVWNSPSVSESLKLFCKCLSKKQSCYYVTKRSFGWWKKDAIERLATQVIKDKIYLLNIVRDPRDVLTSTHKLNERKFYVEPQTWIDSVHAGKLLAEELGSYEHLLTIRYEDVVSNPLEVSSQLQDKFGLSLNPKLQDWSRLKDNLELLDVDQTMTSYMHKLRNFDPATIGKWKEDLEKKNHVEELMQTEEYGPAIRLFMEENNYS